ncbi:carbohydrate kinase family protein [Candidatus Uhrbacteria bacterium]|jgi:ribokinase|nr:carbohydrate kinase family protein [Candidatus Uhrbacteria bacterium]MBT7716815.1 carbohydrate kinase family protein [Candidatus Uhrbacteria bacterium]
MYDIITIGSATRDVFLASKNFQLINSDKFSTGVGECVPFGSKIDVETVVRTTGGGGTNSAATFASLGFNTAVITRVGDDDAAESVINDLKKFNVKTTLVNKIKKGTTGYSVLLTAKNGERSALVHRGVSSEFQIKDVPLKKLKSKWLYITSLAGNTSLALKVVKEARKNKTLIAFNPGGGELSKGLKELLPIMKHLTLFNLNTEEARELTKDNKSSIKELCEKLALPGLTVIITDGPNGAYAHLDGTTWYIRPQGKKAISRTGAGDSFGSGLVSALAKGMGIDEALKVGMLNAESVIQSYGAKIGILNKWPTRAALKRVKVKLI